MAKIAHRADLKLAAATLDAFERAVLASADDGLRPHLGASLIGRPCDRALWYGFRWTERATHWARMLRLFARGQREEAVFNALLRAAGVQVVEADEATGRQFTYSAVGGHFGGSMDGAALGLPDAPQTWHVLEHKTHSAKSFKALEKAGVREAKPEHYAQMQCYMAWTGMERALYCAVNKDDDTLHFERIDFDRAEADRLFARAQRIVEAATPPDGVSDDADYYVCKMCSYRGECHGEAVPEVTCRSCAHATPELDGAGRWSCARHGKSLTVAEQKAACDAHRFIPALLGRFAEVTDANEKDNWIAYALKDGTPFVNGADGFSSAEIRAGGPGMLGDAFVRVCKERFGATMERVA
jgi:hypothetical protein